MSEKQYRIHIKERTPDGEWKTKDDIETPGYLLLGKVEHPEGVNIHIVNLSDADLMLMIVHCPQLRRLIKKHFDMIFPADKLLDKKGESWDEAPGMIDAEELMRSVRDAEAQKPEKPKRTGWLFRRKPKE